MSDENIIEYPHCQDCYEYDECKKSNLTGYYPRFLINPECKNECAYDKACLNYKKPFNCPEYRQWCYEDLEVAKEMGYTKGCYKPPKPTLWDKIKQWVQQESEG